MILGLFFVFLMIFSGRGMNGAGFWPAEVSVEAVTLQKSLPVRVINVVFDDSGSMIADKAGAGANLCDTWCKAKYSVEVFAAMLGENDTMNIYVMSDFSKTEAGAPPKLSLKGSDGAVSNVARIHDMVTWANNTPFNTVRKAYSDLAAAAADDKWLVVLTDGAFQGVDNIDAFFSGKADDVKVMFLGIGADADTISAVESKNIFCERAETNSEILNRITGICNRIFNMDKLNVNTQTGFFSFDVPMSELIVFAQGDGVEISDIKSSAGDKITGSRPVSVRYSEKATTRTADYPDCVVDRSLVGSLVTFSKDFEIGEYTIETANAQTIEIYYKPNVSIAAYLTDEHGNRQLAGDTIEAGTYTLSFGLVKNGTEEEVAKSELLGDVDYSAEVFLNGSSDGRQYSSGDRLQLEQGSVTFNVNASYLKYNTLSTEISYEVFSNKPLNMTIVNSPVYTLEGQGLNNTEEPICVKATLDGRELTAEEWEQISNLSVRMAGEADPAFSFTCEKSGEPGVFNIYPAFDVRGIKDGTYGNLELEISSVTNIGNETWHGVLDGTLNLEDRRNKKLTAEFKNDNTYNVTSEALEGTDKPMEVMLTADGKELTAEQWAGINNISVSAGAGGDDRIELETVKTDTPGLVYIYPKLTEDKPSPGYSFEDYDIKVEASGTCGIDRYGGDGTTTFKLNDTRSWIEKHLYDVLKALAALLIFLFLLGYVPGIKKRLPREWKHSPRIECEPQKRSVHSVADTEGEFKKNGLRRILPYLKETGTLSMDCEGADVPVFRLKARTNRQRAEVMNDADEIEGASDIAFEGKRFDQISTKHPELGTHARVTVTTKNFKYTCHLYQETGEDR